MDYVDKTIQAYDDAPDKFVSTTGSMINEIEMEEMLNLLSNRNGKILDVGCGPGKDTQVLSDMGYKAVGIDLSKELLKRARELHPNLEFKLMDVRKLDFPNSSFDALWCNAILLHLNDDDLKKSLKELLRILVPGGVIAVSFKEGAGEKEVLESFSSDRSRFYSFKTQKTLNDLLERCGFEVVSGHVINERERFGPDKRDLNWVWAFAKKP